MEIDPKLILICAALGLPTAYALMRAREGSRADFLYNSGRTGFWATLAGVVCGNIGIGTFVALLLFSAASPVIGMSLALAYAAGLLICAVVAPAVHALSRKHDVRGLVDLIVVTHGVRRPLLVWLPVAFVFLLRAAVQLIALAAILAAVFPMPQILAIALAALFAGAYTAIGGYRIATETDIAQAAVIVIGMTLLTLSSIGEAPVAAPFFDLGPYRWPILVGIWLFIPASAVLAVDNWQRMATARDPATARLAFLVGAAVCLACYLAIVRIGLGTAPGSDPVAGLHAMLPADWRWTVHVMLVAVVMSTMDTFVMPLLAGLERTRLPLGRLQLAVAALFSLIALAAILLGGILDTIVSAFSSLAVFLPVVWASARAKRPNALAAILSLNVGISATLLLTRIDINTAALAGCALSAAIYVLVSRWADRRVGTASSGAACETFEGQPSPTSAVAPPLARSSASTILSTSASSPAIVRSRSVPSSTGRKT